MSYTLAYKGAEIDDILGRAAPGGALDTAIAAKQDALTFDAVPTEGSTNPAESGGIYDAIQAGGATALAAFATDSVSGDVVSFTDGADGVPVKSLTINIEPLQSGSGDPSPDNVRAISGWTGANITRLGKNLFNINATFIKNSANYSVSGDVLTVTSTVNSSASIRAMIMPITSDMVGKRIALSGTIGGTTPQVNAFRLRVYNDAEINSFFADFTSTAGASVGTVTAAMVGKYLAIVFYAPTTSGQSTTYTGVQVEFSDSATDYEAYNGQTILLDFGQTVYAGTITALGGGKWSVQPTHKIDALDSHTWNYGGNDRFNATGFSDMKQDALRSEYIYCSCYAPNVGGGAFDPFTIYNGTGGYLYVVDDRTTDVATLKTLLAGQKMVYPLATLPDPIILTADDVATLLGQNNLFADCGDIAELTYRADTALYIQKLIGGGDTLQTLSMASPSPSLSLGRVGVLTETEVAEPEQTGEEAEQAEQAEEE